MKVLITGAKGQLGRALVASAPADYRVTAVAIDDLDLTDAGAIHDRIRSDRPDLIVNGSGRFRGLRNRLATGS